MPWYTTDDARRDAEKQAAAKIDPLQSPGVQGLAQLGRNAIDRTSSLDRTIAALSSQLGNLLAVIHRDGGHYESEHGTETVSYTHLRAHETLRNISYAVF